MNIQIINVEKATRQGPKTTYVQLEVTYKDLGSGKVGSKKIMSFQNKEVFEKLSNAANGNQFSVKAEKKGDFWEWVQIGPVTGGNADSAEGGGTSQKQSSAGNAVQSKGNWETSEERAQRQVFIIRQSSLGHAVATLTPGAKTALKIDDVIEAAKKYEDYVFGKSLSNNSIDVNGNEIPAFPDDEIPF